MKSILSYIRELFTEKIKNQRSLAEFFKETNVKESFLLRLLSLSIAYQK